MQRTPVPAVSARESQDGITRLINLIYPETENESADAA